VVAQLSTRDKKLGRRQALELAEQVDEIIASKGKKTVRLDLRQGRPTRASLLALLLGPTGTLRAPAVRKGRTLVLGFDEASYRAITR
jgi:arsenate reductase-like glutaredoxin family protein